MMMTLQIGDVELNKLDSIRADSGFVAFNKDVRRLRGVDLTLLTEQQ